MSTAVANFLFEAANFVLLAAALGWLLFKPVRRALDADRQRRAEGEEELRRAHEELEASTEAARRAREATRREIEQQRSELLGRAEHEAARVREEAEASTRAARRALEQELRKRREAEAEALADVVGRVAADSVLRLLLTVQGPSLDAALVRAACAELAALPGKGPRKAVVESARALEPAARQELARVLGDGFEERIVRELGAGVRVTTTEGQVDATAVSFARHAARTIRTYGGAERDRDGRDGS